jgi:hypothetical protein
MLMAMLMLLAACIGLAEDADPVSHTADLGHAEPAVRAAAAEALRAGPPHDDHGEAYWRERVAQIDEGMARDQVVELLPPVEHGPSVSRAEHWRLDGYWTVTLVFTDETKVRGTPVLQRRARSIWVEPPPGFSGTWVTWYVNGQKSHEITYLDGTYEGVFLSYHDNGERSVEQHYVAGRASGTDTGWYPSGRKKYAGLYVDGKRQGTWEHWYEDGQPKMREELDAGQRTGTWSMWFPNGQLQYEAHYQQGAKHGTDRAWDEAGTLLWSREYLEGQLAP